MRIMAASRNNAAGYYRVRCPFSIMAYRGFEVNLSRPSIHEVDNHDVLWLQQHADAETELLAKAYKDAGKKMVFDMDDWLFQYPPSWVGYEHFFELGTGEPTNAIGFYQRLIDMADVVTVTTAALREKVLDRFPDADVRILPNFIMAGDWDTNEPTAHNLDGPVLGWSGTANHWDDWVEIAPIVDRALAEVGGHLALMGAPEVLKCFPDRLRKRTKVHRLMPFDKMHMVRLLMAPCDVSLAWVSDRVPAGVLRSPLKALQWGAAGVPLVASNTVYGYLPGCYGMYDHVDLDALEITLVDAMTRSKEERAIRAGQFQDTIYSYYSYEAQSQLWVDVLESLE